MGWGRDGTWLTRSLREARAKLRRTVPLFQMEASELKAIKGETRKCFGDNGVIWADATEPGLVKVGYFTSTKGPRKDRWPRKLVASGYSLHEIKVQLDIWRQAQT